MMKKAGRPALGDDKRKARSIKMTDEEWSLIQAKAEAASLSASEFIRNTLLNNLIFVITEAKPLRNPKKMSLVFTALGGGRIACNSKDHQRMIDAFIGLDEIVYAESELFEQYDLEIDDGRQVIYSKKAGD